MKNLITALLMAITLQGAIYADQLAYITKSQAEKGAAFIKTQRQVLLFCGCCDSDTEIYLKVSDVYVKHTGYENYYQVIITGTNAAGKTITEEADLAYVHVNRKGKAVAVGKLLNFECDPCVTDLEWNSDIR